jgi:cytochrome c biogenesis protein ResB
MSRTLATRALLAHFGSLRTTLVCMALLGAAVFAGQIAEGLGTPALVAAMALLSLNLLAALVVHPAFRRQLPLLVFHLALLALVLLAALGRLTSLDGRFELTQGVPFDGTLLDARAGLLHRDGLAALSFRHEGFEIDYAPGRKRGATRNRVVWTDAAGAPQSAVIGDHRPLRLDGYRIYTSPNKGFAPLLRWTPRGGGEPVTGVVHLPAFPAHELRQSLEWTLPDGRKAWVLLQIDETLIDPSAATSFRLPEKHRLVFRMDPLRHELLSGQSVDLDGGTLTYVGLRSWMGYRVSHDPTLPWLLAASLLAALALAWHYTQRFFFAPRGQPASHSVLRGAHHA